MRWFRRKTDDDERTLRPRESTAVKPTPIPPPRPFTPSAPQNPATEPARSAPAPAQPVTPAPSDAAAPAHVATALPATAPDARSATAPDARSATPSEPAPAPIPEGSIADMARVPSHARDTDDMDPRRRAIVDMLRSIYDPEIPVNIYDIGLIYDIDLQDDGDVRIRMTLTSPMCPVAETLPPEVESKVACVDGVRNVTIDLVWEPSWSPVMMSEDARLLLNMM